MSSCALIGLPNTGKTSLFNSMTNSHYTTGNWSGVTVKENRAVIPNTSHVLIDLPGLMGLFDEQDQLDQQVSLKVMNQADVYAQVIDARHLHRDLILTAQLLAYSKPLVVVLTHLEASQDLDRIRQMLPTKHVFVADTICVEAFVDAIETATAADFQSFIEWPIGFSAALNMPPEGLSLPQKLHWLVRSEIYEQDVPMDVVVHEAFYHTARTWMNRYGFLDKKVSHAVHIDQWLLSPWFGLPVFLAVMYLMFFCTIGIGGAVGELFSDLIQIFADQLVPHSVIGMVVYAVFSGIAMCMAFVPILWIMYFFIGYMEQTGYLSRVALLADILMRPLGLSGHSFIPLLLGFGCNVPAVMAVRVVEGRSQRLLTALMVPFISCSARLSVLVVFAGTFFSSIAASLIMFLYLGGLVLAFLMLLWLKCLLQVPSTSAISMNLPRYYWPSISEINHGVSVRVRSFLKRSSKLIVLFSGVFGFFASVDLSGHVVNADQSVLAHVGQWISPYFGFMGLGADAWQPVVALLAGVVAKEVILTTLHSLYHISVYTQLGVLSQVADALLQFKVKIYALFGMSGLAARPELLDPEQLILPARAALAYMVFVLLYFPCISTLVVLRKECGVKWAMVSFFLTTVLSIWAAKVVYSGIGVETFCLLLFMFAAVLFRRGYDTYRAQTALFAKASADA